MKGLSPILYCLPLLLLLSCGQAEESAPPPIQEAASVTVPALLPQPEEVVEVDETIPPTLAESLLAEMTVQEKIGQLFMMDFRKHEDGSDMT